MAKCNGNVETEAPMTFHPNGRAVIRGLSRPLRNDGPVLEENVFPDSDIGKLLQGILAEYLIKQEPRMGWAKRSACDDRQLLQYPIESVASHMWGVAELVMILSRTSQFQEQMPTFDTLKAVEMALRHDVAECITSDITPDDDVSKTEKQVIEQQAMESIASKYPKEVQVAVLEVFHKYETRLCGESKFVKDCDKLDFLITAFLLERQGFSYLDDFYTNTYERGFYSKIAQDLAEVLVNTRRRLVKTGTMFKKDP